MFDPPTTNIISGFYNQGLVALSYFIAVLASFTALDLFGAIKLGKRRRSIFLWRLGTAFAMGGGVWSMHFIAMLAFRLPLAVNYDVWMSIFSFGVAVLAAGIAFYLLSIQFAFRILIGGLVMGLGIATMHYSGMAAMLMDAEIYYDPALFILSILIAVGASGAALWLALKFGDEPVKRQLLPKIMSALIMGIAVVGMHFTGMAGTRFIAQENPLLQGRTPLHPTFLAFFIAIVTLLIMGMGIIASIITKRFAERDATEREINNSKLELQKAYDLMKNEINERMNAEKKLAASESLYRNIVDRLPEIIFQLDPDGKIIFVNPAFKFLGYDSEDLIGKPVEYFIVSDHRESLMTGLATKYVGALSSTDLEVEFRTNRQSTVSEQIETQKYLIDSVGLWNVPDEDVFKKGVEKKFLGTLNIGRRIT